MLYCQSSRRREEQVLFLGGWQKGRNTINISFEVPFIRGTQANIVNGVFACYAKSRKHSSTNASTEALWQGLSMPETSHIIDLPRSEAAWESKRLKGTWHKEHRAGSLSEVIGELQRDVGIFQRVHWLSRFPLPFGSERTFSLTYSAGSLQVAALYKWVLKRSKWPNPGVSSLNFPEFPLISSPLCFSLLTLPHISQVHISTGSDLHQPGVWG